MQLTAKLVQILPPQTGIGKKGEWFKQDLIVETYEKWAKIICISVWKKFDTTFLKIGCKLKIEYYLESREFNGKWYTNVNAVQIENDNDETFGENEIETTSTLKIPENFKIDPEKLKDLSEALKNNDLNFNSEMSKD